MKIGKVKLGDKRSNRGELKRLVVLPHCVYMKTEPKDGDCPSRRHHQEINLPAFGSWFWNLQDNENTRSAF